MQSEPPTPLVREVRHLVAAITSPRGSFGHSDDSSDGNKILCSYLPMFRAHIYTRVLEVIEGFFYTFSLTRGFPAVFYIYLDISLLFFCVVFFFWSQMKFNRIENLRFSCE